MFVFNHIPMDIISQIADVILIFLCTIAAVYDVKYRKIPNWIIVTLGSVWVLAFAVRYFLVASDAFDTQFKKWLLQNVASGEVLPYAFQELISAVSVLGLLLVSILLVNKLRKLLDKPEQSVIGMGDIKLMVAISLYFGYVGSFVSIFIGCALFVLYYVFFAMVGNNKQKTYPFAPFILVGVITAVSLAFYMLNFGS